MLPRDAKVTMQTNAMTLRELLRDVPGTEWSPELAVSGIAANSKDVRPGDVFFCVPGFVADGHDFAADAVKRGAVALVTSRDVRGLDDTVQVCVADSRVALAAASVRFFGAPSEHLDVIGVTGTNGKTTTVHLIDSIMRAAGHVTGMLGTVGTRIGGEMRSSARTTPDSLELQSLLADMVDASVETAVMEVSSHALDLHRVDGVHFAVAAFTNLSQDHLDYHRTIEEYFSVKRRLFVDLVVDERVINIDDPFGAALASDVDGAWTVGSVPSARVRASDVTMSADGSSFVLTLQDGGEVPVEIPLLGAFNVSNALVAAGCALALGIDLDTIARGLAAAPQVPGRLERVPSGNFNILVDYAHTPDGLEKAITALKVVTTGRVIVVFGCGGDRDPEKRPLMGAVVGRLADAAVITSDNPRSEDPVGIVLQVEDGIRPTATPYDVVIDRRKAIARALADARAGDTVLIAGKGHEDYQIFADRTIHFDDREVAREEFEKLC